MTLRTEFSGWGGKQNYSISMNNRYEQKLSRLWERKLDLKHVQRE